jgi:hypothetical protein
MTEPTTTHLVNLQGCDSNTEISIDCTPGELVFLRRLAAAVNVEAVRSPCEPSMAIDGERVGEPDWEDN